jgi:C-terminal processing protease CtpA/Prc
VGVSFEHAGHVKLRRTILRSQAADRGAIFRQVRSGVFYLDLARASNADLAAALPKLVGARGVVFDLRGYPSNHDVDAFFSHLISKPITSSRWEAPVWTSPNREGVQFDARADQWKIAPVEPRIAGRAVFLTDARSISYAEDLLQLVEHWKLGAIVGGATAGTTGNIADVTLAGDYHMRFTAMRVTKIDGTPLFGVGVVPTISVKRTRVGLTAGRDEVLERGIAVVTDAN